MGFHRDSYRRYPVTDADGSLKQKGSRWVFVGTVTDVIQ